MFVLVASREAKPASRHCRKQFPCGRKQSRWIAYSGKIGEGVILSATSHNGAGIAEYHRCSAVILLLIVRLGFHGIGASYETRSYNIEDIHMDAYSSNRKSNWLDCGDWLRQRAYEPGRTWSWSGYHVVVGVVRRSCLPPFRLLVLAIALSRPRSP